MKPFSLVAIIETQRPFLIGLGSLAIFFIFYILVGSNGWGEPASWEQGIGEISRWCERVKEGLFHEPINALSNIGFMVAGLFMLWILGRDQIQRKNASNFHGFNSIALLYASVSIWLGPGSLLMHGTHTAWGAWADNLSMVMYIVLPWLINLSQLADWTRKQFFIAYSALILTYAISRAVFGEGMGINLDLFGLSIVLWVISETLHRFWSPKLRWISGFIGFAVAAAFGITPIDMLETPENYWWVVFFWVPAFFSRQSAKSQRTYRPWFWLGMASYFLAFLIWETGKPGHPLCDPDSIFQAHAAWHLMTAFSTWCFFLFYRTEKKR